MDGRIWDLCSQPAFLGENGTRDLVVWGREKKDWDRVNMDSIWEGVMSWLIRAKKPSVSAAKISCWVISSMRFGKSWREILGIVLFVYLVSGAMISDWN